MDTTCDHIERLEVDEENISADDVIEMLDRLKSTHPKQIIVVETPNGSVDFRIGDALIYEGIGGEIVIDSE